MIDSRYFFNDIADKFKFGKHKYMTLCQVISDDSTYFYWCLENIPSFCITEKVLQQIKDLFPALIIANSFASHIAISVDTNPDYSQYHEYAKYDLPDQPNVSNPFNITL